MKLGIAIPLTADKEYSQFWDSFTLLQKPDYTYLRPSFRGHIDDVRNSLVMQALKENCGALLMLDTDQIYYNQNTILKLLQVLESGKPVIGTVLHRKYPPFDPLVFRFGEQGLVKVPDWEVYSGGTIEADAVGCGCMLYDMQVFKEIAWPWFEDIARQEPDAENAPGEDINFCYKLKSAGFPIWVDTSIEIGHIFLAVANKVWYQIYKKIEEAKAKNIKEK